MATTEEIRAAVHRVKRHEAGNDVYGPSAEQLAIDRTVICDAYLTLINRTPTEAVQAAVEEIIEAVHSDNWMVKEDCTHEFIQAVTPIIQRHTPPVNERLLALVNAVDDTVAGLCCDDVLVDGVLVNWFDARKEALAALEAK